MQEEIGKRLRELRLESNLSIRELSLKIGVNRSRLQRLENGAGDLAVVSLLTEYFAASGTWVLLGKGPRLTGHNDPSFTQIAEFMGYLGDDSMAALAGFLNTRAGEIAPYIDGIRQQS